MEMDEALKERNMLTMRKERWNGTVDEVGEFENIEMDMKPHEAQDLEKGPIFDIQMKKVPRNAVHNIKIGNLLKCIFCRQFPCPKDYYFCHNQVEAHILCHSCFDAHSANPVCNADVPVSVCQDQTNTVGIISETRKCGCSFYEGQDPLYDAMLLYSAFQCVYRALRCSWTGTADAIQEHACQCAVSQFAYRDKMICPVTGCGMKAKSDDQLIQHLTNIHQTVLVPKSDPLVCISLTWAENFRDRVWVPAIVKCPGLDLLFTFELKKGKLFHWIYMMESSNEVSSVCLAGFQDKQFHTMLQEETPEVLDVSSELITRKNDCYCISMRDFVNHHLERNSKNGGRNYMLVMKIGQSNM